MESIKTQPIGTITVNNVWNTELREILHEYFGKNENSYTADFDNEIWSEVLSYLDNACKLINDIELSSGIAAICETGVVNEFLVRFECDKGGKSFLFWKAINMV